MGFNEDLGNRLEIEKEMVNVDLKSDTLYVKKVENLTDDFIMGMDASSVIAEEESGVKYLNFEGEEEDVFKEFSYTIDIYCEYEALLPDPYTWK